MIDRKGNATYLVQTLERRIHGAKQSLERVPRVWNYVVIVLLATVVLHLANRGEIRGGAIDTAQAAGGFHGPGGEDGLLLKVSGLEIDAGSGPRRIGRLASSLSRVVSADLLVRTRIVRTAETSDEVRIDARLVNTEDGVLLWSESYQGSVDEMDKLCGEIRRALWEGMRVELPTHFEGESI